MGWGDMEALLQPHEQEYTEWKAMHPELAGSDATPGCVAISEARTATTPSEASRPRYTDTMSSTEAAVDNPRSKFSDANVDTMRQMTLDTKDQEDREILAKVTVGPVVFLLTPSRSCSPHSRRWTSRSASQRSAAPRSMISSAETREPHLSSVFGDS